MPTDPRIAILSALSSPGWHPVPEAHGMPWDEAEQMLAAYDASRAAAPAAVPSVPADRAAILREAADAVWAMDYDTDANDYGFDSIKDAWDGGTMDASKHLRALADAASGPGRCGQDIETALGTYPCERDADHSGDCDERTEAEIREQAADGPSRMAGEAQQPETQAPDFVTRVLELFSLTHADLYDGALFWRVDDGTVHLSVNVSDVFAWGGVDAEPITPDTLPALEQAYTDLKAIDADLYLPELYAARQRGERPQGAAYPDDKTASWREVSALFDACGPERLLGLGNPKAAPAHKESTS